MNPIATKIVLAVAVAAAKPVTAYVIVKSLQARENRKNSPRKVRRAAKVEKIEDDEVIEATLID